VPASHRVVNKIKASTSGNAAAAPFPLLPPGAYIEPSLPSPAKAPPSGAGWLHEIKHDGMRACCRSARVGIGPRSSAQNFLLTAFFALLSYLCWR